MPTPPVIESAEIVAKTRIFTVERMQLRFSNGRQTVYERIVSGSNGAVLIVPFQDENTILLIREYCAGVQRYELAFPKGRVENGEDILVAANREIMEEVGYAARQLDHIKSVTVSPGYMSHHTHIVFAQQLYPQKLEGDEPEAIEVVPWKLNEIDQLLENPEFTEARSMAALLFLQSRKPVLQTIA